MKRSRVVWNEFFILGMLFMGLSGCSRQGELTQSPGENKSAQTLAPPKDIWVSETTGKEYHVKIENDVLHAEWVNVSPDLAAHGAFIRSECKRQGAKWIGTSASFVPCTVGKGAKPSLDNWCHLETKFEIDSVTADSITGQGDTLVRFDCKQCKILESQMKNFLWRPKR